MATEDPPRSNPARIATLLERWLQWSAIWGACGMLLYAALFVGYSLIGWVFAVTDSPWEPAEFLSITGDQGFFDRDASLSVCRPIDRVACLVSFSHGS